MILPPWLAAMAAWSLLLAYVGDQCVQYRRLLSLRQRDAAATLPATLGSTVAHGCRWSAGVPMWICWRDVKISARLMLLIEAVSVTLIVVVLAAGAAAPRLAWRSGPAASARHDRQRPSCRAGAGDVQLCGFESATALGSEARNPLKTIPRAVILSSILAGVFFTDCAYTEVLGFAHGRQDLGTSDAPMHVLAGVGGMPVLGLLIDVGALVSMFAGMLACTHRRCPRAAADGAQRARPRLAARHPRAQRNAQPRDSRHRAGALSSRGHSGRQRRGWASMCMAGSERSRPTDSSSAMDWCASRFRAICAITTAS